MRLISFVLLAVALLAGLLRLTALGPPALTPVTGGVVRVAFAGNLAGTGRDALRALDLLAREIDATGGMDGLKLSIVPFDDHGSPTEARRIAAAIAEDDSILAVIGHDSGAAAQAAAPIYAAAGIPAITPAGPTADQARNNPWYFRATPSDDAQAAFLAEYAQKAMGAGRIVILHTPHPAAERLATALRGAAARGGLAVARDMTLTPHAPGYARAVTELVEAVRDLPSDTAILLLAPEEPAMALIQAVRDAGLANRILGPDWLGTRRFGDALAQLPRELSHPGLYTGHLLAAAPFLPDIANREAERLLAAYEARFGGRPAWQALYAQDAGRLIAAAVQRAGLSARWSTRSSARRIVRDQLAAIRSPLHAVPGVTGPLYFTEDGSSARLPVVGQFAGGLAAALTQLRSTDAMDDGPIQAGRTAIVQVGLTVNRVADIDPVRRTATIDADLWFRFPDGDGIADAVSDVVFADAAEPISLGAPVERVRADGSEQRLHHLSGRVHIEETPGGAHAMGGHRIGLRFRNRTLSADRLIYAPLQDSEPGALARALAARKVAGGDWLVTSAALTADIPTGLSDAPSRGVERRSGREMASIRFDMVVVPHDQGIRRRVDGSTALAGVFILGLALAGLRIAESRQWSRRWPRLLVLADALLTGLAMLGAEAALLDALRRHGAEDAMNAAVTLFDMLWWLAPALLVDRALHRFVWDPLEQSSERAIPQVVKSTVTLMIMMLAGFGIVAYVLQKDLTSLLATSGVLAMIIGLSLQSNLSNIFSGMVLNLERPFRRGDWIKVGDAPMGQVIDISWRSTKIQTFNNTVISIPNALAAGARIENCSHPNHTFVAQMLLHVTLGHDPDRIVNLLSDALRLVRSVDGRKHLGLVWVKFNGIDEYGMRFLVSFDLTDRGMLQSQEHAVLVSIHSVFRRAGVTLAQRHANIRLVEGGTDPVDSLPDAVSVIDGAALFQPLPREARDRLAAAARPRRCAAGEVVFRRGEAGRSLFLVAEGTVALSVAGTDERDVELSRLGPGAVFGEAALLAGEPRGVTASALGPSMLYEVDEAGLVQALGDDPALIDAVRRMAAAEAAQGHGDAVANGEDAQTRRSASVIARLRGAFGFSEPSAGF